MKAILVLLVVLLDRANPGFRTIATTPVCFMKRTLLVVVGGVQRQSLTFSWAQMSRIDLKKDTESRLRNFVLRRKHDNG
jgi:hypothetical protein